MAFGLSGAALAGIAVGGATLVGGVMQADAAEDAAQLQADASAAGIAEQRRQFDALQRLLSPYANAATGRGRENFDSAAYLRAHPEAAQWLKDNTGKDLFDHYTTVDGGRTQGVFKGGGGSLGAQMSLIGLNGNAAQQSAINGIQNGAEFRALNAQGQNAIMQNASATGGLRGGNVQGALAQFSPRLLSQLIDQQYSRLGGITALGQNAAAGVGNAGMQSANSIGNLLQQQGAALAGGELGQAAGFRSMLGGVGAGLGAFSALGGKF